MQSVASDPASSMPLPGPTSRPARSSDRSLGNTLFASMVDGNAASEPACASTPESPPRRAAQTHATTSDTSRAREPAAGVAADTDPVCDPEATEAASPLPTVSGTTPDPVAPEGGTIAGSAADGTKPATKSSSSHGSADSDPADAAALLPPASAVTPDAIAFPVPAPVTLASVAAAAPASATSTPAAAPLAIAAAAIAASQSVATDTAPVPAPIQAPTDSGSSTAKAAAVAAADPVTVTSPTVAQTATDPSGANMMAPPPPSLAPASPQAAADPPIAAMPAAVVAPASVAPVAPVAPKVVAPKAATASQASTATIKPAEPIAAANAGSPAAHGQPAAAGQPNPPDNPSNPPGADASAASAPAPALTTPHAHAAEPTTTHAASDAPDVNLQPAGAPPPQWPAATANTPVALTATAATAVAVPLSGLALEIAASARNGKSSFAIRLDPAELGRIDVRIDVDRNGRMTSHLMVEKPETLSMLQQDAPQLQRALDNAGFKTGDGGLQFSLRDQSFSGGNDGGGTVPNAQRLIITEDDAIPAAVAQRSYGRMAGSGSGIDISV